MEYDLATVSGILALTTFAVSMLKMTFKSTYGLCQIPVFFVSLGVALLITALSHWAGYLHGSWGVILAQTALATLGSGGLYNVWTGSATQSLDQAGNKPTTLGSSISWPNRSKCISGICFLLGCSMVSGCGNSAQRCFQAKNMYAATLETMVDLKHQGLLSQDQIDKTKTARVTAEISLNAWQTAALTNNSTTANSNESQFQASLTFIQSVLKSISTATTRPATKLETKHGTVYPRSHYPSELPEPAGSYGSSRKPSDFAGRMGASERSNPGS